MPVISLIGAAGALEADLIKRALSDLGGKDLRELSEGEAAEFVVDSEVDIVALRSAFSRDCVDVNLLPDGPREKRLLLADMDSTMIQQECIDELAEEAGFGDQVRDVTARAMNGELDFDEALTSRVLHLKGLQVSVIEAVLKQRIFYTPGGETLLKTMRARGAYTALVSGGFTDFTSAVAARLGFDEHRANILERTPDGEHLSGKVIPPILGREAKVEALRQICAEKGFAFADVLAVGDGANDLGMIGVAGLGVALHAKRSVAAQADVQIDHGDLTALLYLQGIPKSQFIF